MDYTNFYRKQELSVSFFRLCIFFDLAFRAHDKILYYKDYLTLFYLLIDKYTTYIALFK